MSGRPAILRGYPQVYGLLVENPENVIILTKAATRRGWIR